MQEEPDPRVKALYELHLNMEIEHLRIACELMREVEKRDPEALLPAAVGEPMSFRENRKYVRQVLAEQVDLTAKDSEFVPIADVPDDDRYFAYQRASMASGHRPRKSFAPMRKKQGREYRLNGRTRSVEGLRPGERKASTGTPSGAWSSTTPGRTLDGVLILPRAKENHHADSLEVGPRLADRGWDPFPWSHAAGRQAGTGCHAFLMQDHQTAFDYSDWYEGSEDRDQAEGCGLALYSRAHQQIEEELLYPAVADMTGTRSSSGKR